MLIPFALLLGTIQGGPDPVALTRLTIVVDSSTWQDIKASTFLPVGFGGGYRSGPNEVRLCDRLTCVVMVPSDSGAGRRLGDVELGIQPITGSGLADRLAAIGPAAGITILPPPPPLDYTIEQTEMPLLYYLETATVAVSDSTLTRLEPLLRSAGASVAREGEGLVISFPNQTLRLVPDYGGAGVEKLEWRLRREAEGNPTYIFGGRARLRFGPGRIANWTF